MYGRTSNRLNPVDSIPAQKRMVERYAKRHGIEITDYVVDEMKTGTNQNRPGFQKLLQLVEENLVDVIIVAYFDRLGRNSIQMSMFLMKLKQKGIECISVGQDKKLSQMSERDIVQESIYADEENRNRTSRLKASQKSSLKKGEYTHSRVPLGYDKNEERKLIPNQDAEFIRLVFDLFLKFKNVSDVVKHLKDNDQWNNQSISNSNIWNILSNKVYLGNLYMNEKNESGEMVQTLYSPNSHEAIVEEETFERVQTLLGTMKRQKAKNYFHLFSGILVCMNCGDQLSGSVDKYVCRNKDCKTNILKKQIEPSLLNYLLTIGEDETKIKEKYKRKISAIQKQQKKQEEDFAISKISLDRLNERLFLLDEQMHMAYEIYMKEAFKLGNYKELIKNNQLTELKEAMENRGLKIGVNKLDKKTFDFTMIE
ncbi:recombinase family protein [Bacillus salitolerans]|uniref:Recombinase family protein n=1 Tax=Bacillus salitolerans TaxID=1437434 RepID=A0ABW4LS28_9BACI